MQKHHKKYLWGVTWFFWLFKLFSFLVLSIATYTITSADTPISFVLEIPATTIDIQNEQNIIQFDLSSINTGDFDKIKNMTLHIDINTKEESLDMDTLRNSTINFLWQTNEAQNLTLHIKNTEKNIRTIDTENISWIIQQLTIGNTIAYLLPQEKINIGNENIFIEIELEDMQNPINESKKDIIIPQENIPENNNKTLKIPKTKNKEEIKQNLRDNWFKENNDGKFITKDNIDLTDTDWEILVPIIMESTIDTWLILSWFLLSWEILSWSIQSWEVIQVEIPAGTVFKDKNQNIYTSIINAPQFLDISQIQNPPGSNTISIFEVGTENQEIYFEDQNQNESFVDITVPLPGYQSGKKVNVYFSSDKSSRSFLTETIIESSWGISYTTFKTSHFTSFSIDFGTENFFIGDATCSSELTEAIYTDNVHLCLQPDVLDQMKFALSAGVLPWMGWLSFSGNYTKNLGSLGMTTNTQWQTYIYAQYDRGGDFQIVSDAINIKQITQWTKNLASWWISDWNTLNINNFYQDIQSTDGISKVYFNFSSTTGSSITVSNGNWDGLFLPPTKLTNLADSALAKQGEPWLPANFLPWDTYRVGADNWADLTLSSGLNFTITLKITDPRIIVGKIIPIYYSSDGNSWQTLTTATVAANKTITFQSPHTTLFAVGSTTRNNLNFVTQDFRSAGPNTGQIIDAFFGTGGNPSAYTTHRSTGCRPTSLVTRNPWTRWATTLTTNTIYVLNSWNYIQTASITFGGNCIAFVGSGNVNISKTTAVNILSVANRSYIIIDNIELNGSGLSNSSINLAPWNSATINDIQAYYNTTHGINMVASNRILVNNSQAYKNTSVGIYFNWAWSGNIINNCQSYNNNHGFYIITTSWLALNNSQTHNNAAYGIYVNATWTVINNTETYNNTNYGIYLNNAPNTKINNLRSFKNTPSPQVYSIGTTTWNYYGNNIAYPTTGFALLSAGYDPTLWWNTGTISTTNNWYNWYTCDFVSSPFNGEIPNLWFYSTSDCSNIWTSGGRLITPIIKYRYGNNMLSWYYVPRQIQPVMRFIWWGLGFSDIPYHGHRFIGEYYDPSGRDMNIPVNIFTWETPPQWTNVLTGIYSWNFTVRSYIYEPNIYHAIRYANISGATTYNSVYDSGLVLMMNFDNIAEIGETSTLVKDLSLQNNYGDAINSATRTGNSKWNGGYIFNGTNQNITITGYWANIPNQEISIAIRADATPAAWQSKAIFGTLPDTTSNRVSFTPCYTNNNMYRDFGSTSVRLSTWCTAASIQWRHHRVLIASQAGNFMKIYKDWVEIATRVGANTFTNSGTINWAIWGGATIGYFSWSIDEPRIYNRALTSWEVEHLYTSNLSSKSDHREYVVDYTWVWSRSYGTHLYGREAISNGDGLIDMDSNSIQSTWYVIKYLNCGAGFTITRDNDNSITSWFWNQNPIDCDIIYALYGTWITGVDETAYTNSWSGRAGACNFQNMYVVYTGNLSLSTLAANTIYVTTGMIDTGTAQTNMADCSAVISNQSTGTTFYTNTWNVGAIFYASNKNNIIIDNIRTDGTGNGAWWSHTQNSYWINFESDINTTINNCETYNAQFWIMLYQNQNNHTNNSRLYKNDYNIGYYGTINSILTNNQIHSTPTGGYWISFVWAASNITFNNNQIFNNGYGISFNNDSLYKDYITINNSQIYNNTSDWILLYYTRYFTINNTHIYNNWANGINFASTNNNSGILNNIFAYNNGSNGIFSTAWTHKFYGKLTTFSNDGGAYYGITWGLAATYSYLWRTGGSENYSNCMNCSRISNPRNTTYVNLIDTTLYPKCNLRGANLSWAITGDLDYTYGINLTGQKLPVYRTGTSLTGSSLWYSWLQYVAEINSTATDYTNTTCTCASHTYRWDNNNFIDNSFWNNNPDYCDIIAALYGEAIDWTDGTAYTYNRDSTRSGQCNVENTEVTFLTWGTGKIDYNMASNTVYVLTSGDYIQTGIINFSICNAILGSGTTVLYSTGALSAMIYWSYSMYNVFDNIIINGTWGWVVPVHTQNDYWILLFHTENNSINNVKIYNNDNGIYINDGSDFNNINNSELYNNGNWISFYISFYNVLNNIQTYNNNNGILINSSNGNSINNSQSYNNNTDGINLSYGNSANSINNSLFYNNSNNWITLFQGTNNNFVNDSQSYNNNGYWVYVNNSSSNEYFSTNILFNNQWWNTWGNNTLTQWGGTYYSTLWRTTGLLITTWTMMRDYVTIPVNGLNAFMTPVTGYSWTWIIGQQQWFTVVQPMRYTYGSGILLQTQPVFMSWWSVLQTWWVFSGVNFIWSELIKITGDLILPGITSYTSGITVTGISSSSLVNRYAVRGNTLNVYSNITINTSTGIFLDTSVYNDKKLFVALYKANLSYFAMHFQKDTTLDTTIRCKTWRDNNNFITSDFWSGTVTDNNIICALYGTGIGDTTAYTEFWTWRDTTQCSGIDMSVVYTGTLPTTWSLNTNTIYVVNSGTYNRSNTINMADCSAIISSGNVTMKKTASVKGITTTSKNKFILDNIKIDGNWNADVGIYSAINSTNSAINNCEIFNNSGSDAHGIFYFQSAGATITISNHSISNTKIYNNQGAWTDGIKYYVYNPYNTILNSIKNNNINNSQIYNNASNGIEYFQLTWNSAMGELNNNSINNTQVYNNWINWIYYYNRADQDSINNMNNNIINNSNVFNNGNYGINFQTYYGSLTTWTGDMSGGIINNSNIYNNTTYNIWFSSSTAITTPIKYYGALYMAETTDTNYPTLLTTGFANDFPWIFTTGTAIISWTMSRDYITNPINTLWNYLLSWSWVFTTGTIISYNNTTTDRYSYGSGILTQIQPVYYSWSTLTTWGLFNTTQYIWSSITKYTWSLLGLPTTTITTWLTVSGNANATYISNYSIFWDIFTFNIWQAINTNTGIFLTAWDGTKRIVTQIYSGTDFATHFQTDTTLDTTIGCKTWRDNSNFITSDFWSGTVTDNNIICALYGTGIGDTTAYTEFWTWRDTTQCSGRNMNVIYTEKIWITNLATNTIYVVTGTISTWSTKINIADCSTVISNQATGTTFYTTVQLVTDWIFYATTKQYNILDNISINGTGGGPVPAHTGNYFGIWGNGNSNMTINNSLVHDSYANIHAIGGNNIILNNFKSYNADNVGISMASIENGVFNNIQSYNNDVHGIALSSVADSVFNNIQSYNNNNVWFNVDFATNIIINNSQIYNNGNNGIVLAHSTGFIINTVRSYNNGRNGINLDTTAIDTIYFGTGILFNNELWNIWWAWQLTQGTGIYYSTLWRTTGNLDTWWTMSFDYITNPINTLWDYLVSWTDTWISISGQKIDYKNTTTDKYSYGSGILIQTQPVTWSWTTPITWGNFGSTNYIWSDVVKVIGSAAISWTIITWSSANGLISNFSVFWDITSFKIWQVINTSTWIILTTWLSTNRIVTQLYDPINYFATHFQKNVSLTSCILQRTGTTPTAGATLTGNNFKPQLDISECTIGIDTFNYTLSGITYPYYDSWLVLMMNFDNVAALWETTGIKVKDFSQYENNWTGTNSPTRTGNGKRNGKYGFDGINDYIKVIDNWELNNETGMTYSVRVKVNSLTSVLFHGTIIGKRNNGGTLWTNEWNLWFSWNTDRIPKMTVEIWSTKYSVWWSSSISINERHNITVTKDATKLYLYVDGILVNSWSAPGNINNIAWRDLYVWTIYSNWSVTNFTFTWDIDEPRIRKRTLSSWEILQMRRSNLAKYNTGNWLFTDDRQCVRDGTYTYTGYILNNSQLSATTGRTNIVNITNPFVTAPTGYYIGSTWVSSSVETLSGQFTGFFKIEDREGTTGWYTTIQLPLIFTWVNYTGNKIINNGTNIQFMATGVTTEPGWTNSGSVYIYTGVNSYTGSTGAMHYMKRYNYTTPQYSCPAGIYENKPSISIEIPAYQNSDIYSGLITIDFNAP